MVDSPLLVDTKLTAAMSQLVAAVEAIGPRAAGIIDRWLLEAAALLFHLSDSVSCPRVCAVLGGTGTGKSTLVNRLLDGNISAASFRRTFTAGPVAVASSPAAIPQVWLGLSHLPAKPADLPVRGQADALVIAAVSHPLLNQITLVDTPDLDGDQPLHHAQADRVFRWAQAVIFLVSPEKYQMTEMLPYYRLAARYALPAVFVMNKCENAEMLADYAALVRRTISVSESGTAAALPAIYAVARDDAGYEPPADANLAALGRLLAGLQTPDPARRSAGLRQRVSDGLGRLRDQVLSPLLNRRAEINKLISALKAMETPPIGVDVNPITEQLQRRLQQRSVLYLMGPGRMLDRVRQMPGMLVRLPRATWDMVMHGKAPDFSGHSDSGATDAAQLPDFRGNLVDQFTVIQSRIDDVLRTSPSGKYWLEDAAARYSDSKLDPTEAGKIAAEELADLKTWLQKRWNATPRDTLLLLKLLRYLPGGQKLTQWTEAAPYLLAIIVATHHALFGHVDLMILGGYTLATWLTERLSNEVAARTRQTNRAVAGRFGQLAHQQILKTCLWLNQQAPFQAELLAIENQANQLQENLGEA